MTITLVLAVAGVPALAQDQKAPPNANASPATSGKSQSPKGLAIPHRRCIRRQRQAAGRAVGDTDFCQQYALYRHAVLSDHCVLPGDRQKKWRFNTHSKLKALTQAALKTRGVAYWAADNPTPGKACQKIVYLGTMDARLFAVDADTGKKCPNFADHGVLDVSGNLRLEGVGSYL